MEDSGKLLDALGLLGWYGFNTRAVMLTNEKAMKAAQELITEVMNDPNSPPSVRTKLRECFQ